MELTDAINAICLLLAGLGILLVGFKLLSDNIEKIANNGLKKMFNKTSKNPLVGVGVGALVTAIIQSSSASTVMVVGFVNAGIMNLFQATCMIMGANIGTTITAQIVALNEFDITIYAMLLAPIGIFMNMLAKKDKIKSTGLALAGLGIVFIALQFMSDAMVIFRTSDVLLDFLKTCDNPILLLLFGVAFTALIQSSSAVTTILITMVASGISIGTNSNSILYVVLGSNIGTCVTALLSSIGAHTNAKRASLLHLLFNLIGSSIFFIVLIVWPSFMDVTFKTWFADNPSTQIAMFHTLFNVSCTLIFLPFANLFVKIAELFIKDKQKVASYVYIDERFLKTPSIALAQASKETLRLGKLSMDTLSLAIKGFLEKNVDYQEEINESIKTIDELNQRLLAYLVKVAAGEVSNEDEQYISKLHNIINDFYREVEIADNMLKYTNTTIKDGLSFSDNVYAQIKVLQEKLMKQFDNVSNMMDNQNFELINTIDALEDEIDTMRSDMIQQHIDRLERNECSPASSGVFINLVSNLERAGDHLGYIAHSLIEN